MASTRHTQRPIFASDVRRLGGVVRVEAGRDRVEGAAVYHIAHASRGGDCCWRSGPIQVEDHAFAGARLLAEFVGAEVRIADPRS
jgi:hypothetical protein